MYVTLGLYSISEEKESSKEVFSVIVSDDCGFHFLTSNKFLKPRPVIP